MLAMMALVVDKMTMVTRTSALALVGTTMMITLTREWPIMILATMTLALDKLTRTTRISESAVGGPMMMTTTIALTMELR